MFVILCCMAMTAADNKQGATAATGVVDPDVVALSVTDSMINIDHQLHHVPAKTALELVEFCRRRLDATEARILADRYEKGASDRDVEDMAKGSDNKTSKAAAKKKARRAKATNANPDLADRLAKGDMSSEQVDVIADAADETDGAAACDEELIDTVSKTNPEQGKKKAREYVNQRRDANDVQRRFDRQNRKRGVYTHRLANGNKAITLHGPDEYIDEIEQTIHAASDTEYQADGGRDVPNHKHPRTHDQRNFDAVRKLLTRNSSDAASGKANARPSRTVSRRATIFVRATVDQLTGTDPSPLTNVDGKPLPQSLVEELMQDANWIGQIFSAQGELLWQGRNVRLATPAQINGLISRDGGCVECGAHYSKCVAHHLLPWEAAKKGPTNINNLVLLCADCHTRLHRNKHTMYFDFGTQTWKTRRATADEIPPDGGPAPNKPPGKYKAKRPQKKPEPGAKPRTKPHLHERQPQPGIRPSLF